MDYLHQLVRFGVQTGVGISNLRMIAPPAKGGDVLVKFGDSKIAGPEDIDGALRKFKAGDKVPVIVLRDGKELEVSVTLALPR